ncbi:hypothetical protein MNBD_NITROSPIRAE02-954 [hydrothermal vent metagenome]|uniref:Cytochrome c domain-containing protein n=1 Tax=hydrothermal vent metagenome TaxID=652676 RepID=A0A3B1CJC1_9ZZZZ
MNILKTVFRAGMVITLAATLFSFGCSVDGASLFQKEGCINCHRFKGAGGSICPDLTDVASKRSDAWLRQQIKDPGVNYPDSTMPGFGHLSEKEIQALIDYLKS